MTEHNTHSTPPAGNPPPAKPAGRTSAWKHFGLGVLIFVCGLLTGLALSAAVIHHGFMKIMHGGMPEPALIISHIDAKLHLDDAQEAEVETILTEEFALIKEIRQERRGLMHARLAAIHDRIGEVLTDEQKAQWEQDIQHIEEFFLQHGPHGEGGGAD